MVDWIHGNTAIVRPLAQPARTAGFPERDVFVFNVPDLADCRHALHLNSPYLTRRQLEQRDPRFLRHQLRLCASRPRHLAAFAGSKFDIVNDRAGRNVLQGKRIAGQDVGIRAGADRTSHFKTNRTDDVAFLAVRVVQQSNACRPVRIVFNGCHFRKDTKLVALEIDDPVSFLRATAAKTTGCQTP